MDRQKVEERLTELLRRVLEGESATGTAKISMDAPFSQIGVNSVDLLEFVIAFEDEFNYRVLDELLPEDLPSTLTGWRNLLIKRVQGASSAA